MNDLPNAIDVDPEEITSPVLTRQGWVTPNPESIPGLARLVAQIHAHSPTSGFRRDLSASAVALLEKLRLKHAGDAKKLARIDAIVQP